MMLPSDRAFYMRCHSHKRPFNGSNLAFPNAFHAIIQMTVSTVAFPLYKTAGFR